MMITSTTTLSGMSYERSSEGLSGHGIADVGDAGEDGRAEGDFVHGAVGRGRGRRHRLGHHAEDIQGLGEEECVGLNIVMIEFSSAFYVSCQHFQNVGGKNENGPDVFTFALCLTRLPALFHFFNHAITIFAGFSGNPHSTD